MIRYSLLCEHDHAFDSWFDSSAAYDRLSERHLVECPACGSTDIRKALMTPNVSPATRRKGKSPLPHPRPAKNAPPETPGAVMASPPDPRLAELQAEALRLARNIREHVASTADYVGDRFAEEARRIHFGEVEAHGIYGEASLQEAAELVEEGIEVHPLPSLPEDSN